MSVLHHACIEYGHEALKILLRNLPNDASATVDELGRTPLQLCFDLYRPICALILLEETTVELVVDKNGWSLAHHAVKMGNEHVLERILRIDRNLLHSKTNNGESLIDLARKYGKLNSGIGEVLRKAMRLNPDEFAEFDRRIPSSFEILSMVR
jgi:ankyrin repeat protein